MSDPEQRPAPQLRRVAGFSFGRILGVPLVVSRAWIVLVVIATLAGPSAVQERIDIGVSASYAVVLALILLVYAAADRKSVV